MRFELVSSVKAGFCTFAELSPTHQTLIRRARDATRLSYSPYSRYCVGCAIALKDGEIVVGANHENASYGLTCCAERTTIFTINNMGRRSDISTIAVTARPADADSSYVGKQVVAPCGACRQIIKESEDLAGSPIFILMDCFDNNNIACINGIAGLLPLAFGPADLGITI